MNIEIIYMFIWWWDIFLFKIKPSAIGILCLKQSDEVLSVVQYELSNPFLL